MSLLTERLVACGLSNISATDCPVITDICVMSESETCAFGGRVSWTEDIRLRRVGLPGSGDGGFTVSFPTALPSSS